jgi:hypothetical protein
MYLSKSIELYWLRDKIDTCTLYQQCGKQLVVPSTGLATTACHRSKDSRNIPQHDLQCKLYAWNSITWLDGIDCHVSQECGNVGGWLSHIGLHSSRVYGSWQARSTEIFAATKKILLYESIIYVRIIHPSYVPTSH